MKIAIITDSGSNLSQTFIKKHPNLAVMSLLIIKDGKNYRDQLDITSEEVYASLDSSVITTSLPNIDSLLESIQSFQKKDYTDILILSISSGLSGTYNAFRLALQSVTNIHIHLLDTLTLAGGQGLLVIKALELVKNGLSPKEILENLKQIRNQDMLALYTISTLKYLRRGGRIGKVEGTIGDLLHIKPVITVNAEGVYQTVSKAMGIQRSLISMKDLLVQTFKTELIDLVIHYGDDLEKAKQLGEMLKKHLNIRTLWIEPLTPVLGIHTGPSMFAYIAAKV